MEQIEIASKIVSQWPEWKKNILEHSLQPTIKVARTPVDNRVRRGAELRTLYQPPRRNRNRTDKIRNRLPDGLDTLTETHEIHDLCFFKTNLTSSFRSISKRLQYGTPN